MQNDGVGTSSAILLLPRPTRGQEITENMLCALESTPECKATGSLHTDVDNIQTCECTLHAHDRICVQ